MKRLFSLADFGGMVSATVISPAADRFAARACAAMVPASKANRIAMRVKKLRLVKQNMTSLL